MNSFSDYGSINIDEVCRICLTKQEHMNFISEAGLPDLLCECTSIQILEEDIYHLVCNSCSNEVSRWYIFKQQVIQSFEIGRWLIKQKITRNDFEATVNEEQLLNNTPSVNSTLQVIGSHDISVEDNKISYSEEPIIHSLAQYSEDISLTDNVEIKLKREHPKVKASTLICEVCNRVCPTLNALVRHKKVHKDTKDYICSKCGKAFKQAQTLADHMKRHYDLKKFACDQCGRRFYKQYNVNMHMRMHTGEKPYQCTQCEKSFTRPLLLRNHIKQRHTQEKKYVCQECGKGFIDGWQLKIHIRTHTGEKPYKCPHCEMSFAVSSSLHSHVRYKHTFEKNFICSMCAKAFTAKHTLDDHMRIHTGEKKPPRHECPTCGKKCDSTSTLKYHVRAAHTGEKPFACEVCQKKFVRKQHLTAHMRNHTGEKPYVCPHCDKTFGSSSSFSIHKRIHTGERPFVCNTCNQSFIQSAGLKQHMKTHNR